MVNKKVTKRSHTEHAQKSTRGTWVYVGREDADLMISSLLHQIDDDSTRRTLSAKKGKRSTPAALPREPESIYQLKVTLKNSQPAIWRRVQVPADLSLAHLHSVLQLVMGWTNSHMHQFKVGERYFGTHDLGLDDLDVEDERQFRLDQIAPKVKARFIYEYDFGDSWEHLVVVEKILPPEKGITYPRCTAGARACPPEDVGGVWGYRDFLEAIQNPRHPDHTQMLEWVGEEFNPEHFDLDGVNGMLKRYSRRRSGR